jgi:hypothetical protein
MPSPSQLLPTAEFPKLAEMEISTAAHPPPYDSTQRTREQAKFDPAIMAKTCESAKIWPPYPSSLCPETKAKFKVSCIECDNFEDDERDWQGRVIGRGLHGSLSALLTRVKHKYRLFMDHEPLIRLLTVCTECCTKLDLYHEVDQIDQIFSFRDNNERSGGMVLRISYKEIEEIVCSKVIVMEGVLLNAGTIKTVGVDGKWRKWYLWNQRRSTLAN